VFKVRTTLDFYGASSIFGANGFRDASWLHGWIFSDLISYRQLIDPIEDLNRLHFVWTESQKKFLLNEGYQNVYDVGAPFLYFLKNYNEDPVKSYDTAIFPPHSISKNSDRPGVLSYVEAYLEKNPDERVVISLHCADWDNQDLIYGLRKLNVAYVKGAVNNDPSTYTRLITLFRSVNKVVTPTFGSHIPYAMASGCKVIIDFENFIEYDLSSEYLGHPYWPDLEFRRAISVESEFGTLKSIKNNYEFINNLDVEQSYEWAMNQLGKQSLMKIEDLNQLFVKSSFFRFFIVKVYFRVKLKLKAFLEN